MAHLSWLEPLGPLVGLLLSLLVPHEPEAAQAKYYQDLVRMLEYDRQMPLDIREGSVEDKEGARVHDLSYVNRTGARFSAYLVVPAGRGPFAGLVFLHGGGQDRSTFLPEALLLAKAGAVSLLIDVPAVRAAPNFTRPGVDRDLFIDTLTGLRRGIDLLAGRRDVDEKRIGYIGMSYGANLGGVLAGVERRVKAYVLMAGLPSYTELWRTSKHPGAVRIRESLTKEQLESYLAATAPFDAVHHIGRAKPSVLLFQFARHDEVVTEQAALQYSRSGSEPKVVKWYDARHEDIFKNAEALDDRLTWLREQLGIGVVNASPPKKPVVNN